jgi:hypothetical protein
MPVALSRLTCYLPVLLAPPELLDPVALEPELGTAPGPDVAGVPGVPFEPGSFTVWGER